MRTIFILLSIDFTHSHILQGLFTGTKAMIKLSQHQWSNPERYIDGLVQERHNFIANALEISLYCTHKLICE